jgi:hypothetical protein
MLIYIDLDIKSDFNLSYMTSALLFVTSIVGYEQ